VSSEQRGPVEILRYSGTHACTDEDHARDREMGRRLADGIITGRGFLLDVRRLHIVYPSGIADMVNPWLPTTTGKNAANAARVAILWKPVQWGRKGWRWGTVAETFSSGLKCFTEEDEALKFLSSSESGTQTAASLEIETE
jgi:hypothetical protein